MRRFRVMTLNLLFEGASNRAGQWSERRPLVVEVVRSHQPDILGVQEANERQVDDLLGALPNHRVVMGPESGPARVPRPFRTPSLMRGEHCAIFFSNLRYELVGQGAFWLSRAPHRPGSVLPGTWLPRVVNWVRLRDESGASITCGSAHFDFMPWAPTISARIVCRHFDAAWDGSFQLLLGDFNATRFSRAFRCFCRPGEDRAPPFLDAWLEAESRHGPSRTYHAGVGHPHWFGRLDRILFRPSVPVERAVTETHHLGETYPSDHFPVMADFAIAKR